MLLLKDVTRDCCKQEWNDDMKSQKNLFGKIIQGVNLSWMPSDVSGIMKIWNTGF